MTVDKLEQLAGLSKKATQGEWRVEGDGHVYAQDGWLYDTKYGDGLGGCTNADFTVALVNWYRSGGAELARNAERDARRLKMLHEDIHDPEGYEIGIYLVKWKHGMVADIKATYADFRELDAAIAARQVGGEERG